MGGKQGDEVSDFGNVGERGGREEGNDNVQRKMRRKG